MHEMHGFKRLDTFVKVLINVLIIMTVTAVFNYLMTTVSNCVWYGVSAITTKVKHTTA